MNLKTFPLPVKLLTSSRMKVFCIVVFCVGILVTNAISRRIEEVRSREDVKTARWKSISNEILDDVAHLDTLRLVQVIYRHGDRTPIDRYPNDPYDSRTYFPEGWGMLTQRGKMMQYSLGEYIRQRYNGFLSDSYAPEEIYVQSSSYDRTISSAMANLAGMWPLTSEEVKINGGKLLQQYVPVHSICSSEDNKIAFSRPCPKYWKEVKETPDEASQKVFDLEHAELYKYLSKHTGKNITDIHNATEIYDTLFVQKCHNLTLPEWANQVFPDQLREVAERTMKSWTRTDEMRRLRAGPLLTDLVRNMKRIAGKPNEQELKVLEQLFRTPAAKFYVYSGHDTTLIPTLDALGLYSGEIPPYASSLYFELHEQRDTLKFVVKIFYRPHLEKPATELVFKKCNSNPCPLEDFVNALGNFIIDEKDWEKECSLD